MRTRDISVIVAGKFKFYQNCISKFFKCNLQESQPSASIFQSLAPLQGIRLMSVNDVALFYEINSGVTGLIFTKKIASQLFHFWHTCFQVGCFGEFLCQVWQLWKLETLRFSSTLSSRCTSWSSAVVLILHLLIHDSFIMSYVRHLVDMNES